jgi:hypothetical protein
MALWGKRDRYSITGTANVVQGSAIVTGNASAIFTTEIDNFDSLYINGTHVKVASVTSANTLTLSAVWTAANASAQTIYGQDSPKYVLPEEIDKIYGADLTEVQVQATHDKGIITPGWIRYKTYTDMHGKTRNKVESLVVMRSMTAAVAGDADGTSIANT